MTQIGYQRHTRSGSRRRVSFTATSVSGKRRGFVKTALEITLVAFMVLTVALFVAFMFDCYAPVNGASDCFDDHHPDGSSIRSPLNVPVSPPLSFPPSEMHLRGSGKRASIDESGSRDIDLKARLRLEQKRAADIGRIVLGADATLKAAQDAVKEEMAAVAAVADAIAITPPGMAWGRDAWDVSITEKNAF